MLSEEERTAQIIRGGRPGTASLSFDDDDETPPPRRPARPVPADPIPRSLQSLYIYLSVLLLGYGALGLAPLDLVVPGARVWSLDLEGMPSLMLALAMLSALLCIALVIADRQGWLRGRLRHRLWARVEQSAAWLFFFLALGLDFLLF